MKEEGGKFLDLLYPPQCLGCDLWYSSAPNAVWCPVCDETAGKITDKIIRTVEDVLVYSAHHYACIPVARVARALKYERVYGAARLCGEWIAQLMQRIPLGSSVLIPVPLHEKRLAERGFNQSELIAREAGLLRGVTIDTTLLQRTLYTAPQALSNEQERQQHMVGAFAATRPCDPALLYVLIDDVITTGSTLAECVKTLRGAGAVHICALTAASTRE